MIWSALDTRRAARTPARYCSISCLCVYLYKHTACMHWKWLWMLTCLDFSSEHFDTSQWWKPNRSVCVSHLCRVIQEGPLSARWQTGPGCRLAWWVSGLAVLTETSQVCTPDWQVTRASSATRFLRSDCMEELTWTGVGGLPCWSAVCPPYCSCFRDKMFTNWISERWRASQDKWRIYGIMSKFFLNSKSKKKKKKYLTCTLSHTEHEAYHNLGF